MPTALIVEDEPAANQLLSMLVQLRGYQTESAFTGEEAIKKADDSRPDVVFLDLMLPDINGYDVCKTLKERRATSNIPVVMVTARLAAENRIEGFRAGAVDYVPKPYTPDQIFQAMTHANSSRLRIAELPETGEIVVKVNDEVGYFRQAAELRSLLLSRTRLDEDVVRDLGASLMEILQRGVDWARSRDRDRAATLDFHLSRDRVAFTIRDESGWFAHDDPSQNGLANLLAQSNFDDIAFRNGVELRLLRSASQ